MYTIIFLIRTSTVLIYFIILYISLIKSIFFKSITDTNKQCLASIYVRMHKKLPFILSKLTNACTRGAPLIKVIT